MFSCSMKKWNWQIPLHQETNITIVFQENGIILQMFMILESFGGFKKWVVRIANNRISQVESFLIVLV